MLKSSIIVFVTITEVGISDITANKGGQNEPKNKKIYGRTKNLQP